MSQPPEPIVFFGSGPVAAESLRRLAADFKIEAVVTKPRAAHHTGEVPVLALAEELQLPVFTATDRQSLDELFAAAHFISRLGILVDFGIIVSQAVIDYFPLGIINSHFSLLPQWRGADPITFAILSGQEETGVSLMLLVEKMDEGPLLAWAPHELSGRETTPELTAELIELSNALLKEIVPEYIASHLKPQPQDSSIKPTYSRKLSKADGLLDWHKPAVQLEREIRAFAGWPQSRTTIAGKEVIITQAHVGFGSKQAYSAEVTSATKAEQAASSQPGSVFVTPKKELAVQTSKDLFIIDRLKPAGKREMSAKEFLAGYKI